MERGSTRCQGDSANPPGRRSPRCGHRPDTSPGNPGPTRCWPVCFQRPGHRPVGRRSARCSSRRDRRGSSISRSATSPRSVFRPSREAREPRPTGHPGPRQDPPRRGPSRPRSTHPAEESRRVASRRLRPARQGPPAASRRLGQTCPDRAAGPRRTPARTGPRGGPAARGRGGAGRPSAAAPAAHHQMAAFRGLPPMPGRHAVGTAPPGPPLGTEARSTHSRSKALPTPTRPARRSAVRTCEAARAGPSRIMIDLVEAISRHRGGGQARTPDRFPRSWDMKSHRNDRGLRISNIRYRRNSQPTCPDLFVLSRYSKARSFTRAASPSPGSDHLPPVTRQTIHRRGFGPSVGRQPFVARGSEPTIGERCGNTRAESRQAHRPV